MKPPGCQNLPAAGVGGIDRHLRRKQHGVDPGVADLLRHQLAVADVALQRRAVAVEEHHDHAGLGGVETLRHVHQHAAVIVGLVLPVDAAGTGCGGSRRSPVADVEERARRRRGLVPK